MNNKERIQVLEVIARSRVEEYTANKFPELRGMYFDDEDILDLLQFALLRKINSRKENEKVFCRCQKDQQRAN